MTKVNSDSPENKLSRIKYVICDWDGTLVDSMNSYSNAFANVMSKIFGVDFGKAKEYYLSTAGASLSDQFKKAARRFAQKKVANTQELEHQFWDLQLTSGQPKVIEGAAASLRQLKEKGLRITVWSGTRTDILGRKLEQTKLSEFVDFYIGNTSGSSTQVKGPRLFAKIAKHFGISNEDLQKQSVVIGDGKGDIESGIDVSCLTIGIPKIPEDKEVLEKAGVDFIIPSIKDLPSLLSK